MAVCIKEKLRETNGQGLMGRQSLSNEMQLVKEMIDKCPEARTINEVAAMPCQFRLLSATSPIQQHEYTSTEDESKISEFDVYCPI